jgi:hypothetical protein
VPDLGAQKLSDRALNRALLARQGLLEPLTGTDAEVVEAIGPVQAQNWAAPPVAIWARTDKAVDLKPALEQQQLIYGFLLRGTLHVVSARHYPSYAAVVEASGVTASPPEMGDLRRDLLGFASRPRAGTELVEFIEDWVGRRGPGLEAGELERQRTYRWRPLLRWTALVRAPEDGRWGRKAPLARVAAPVSPERWPASESALKDVVTWHLRAFGPAGPDDVAQWIGWRTPPVRAAMEGMDLERFEDERGRKLYDLPDAPRPPPEVPAPPRLLPWFDNAILAYAPAHRARILPDEHKDRVYQRANLQWLPTILVDGMVAGTWAPRSGLNPFAKLPRPVVAELEALLAQCPA